MAPSHSTPISASESAPTAQVNENILPLQLEKNRVIPKDQQVIFKLRTDPAVATSPTYQMTMVILNGTEGCRAAIKLVTDLETVCTGLNIPRTVELGHGLSSSSDGWYFCEDGVGRNGFVSSPYVVCGNCNLLASS